MHAGSIRKSDSPPLKPLHLLPSLLYFGLPALLFVAGFHGLMPWLTSRGVLPYYAYLLGLGVPLALLLAVSLAVLRWEGHELKWAAVKARFRLGRMDRKAWLWAVGAIIVGGVGYGLVSPVSYILIAQGILPIPAGVPEFMNPLSSTDPMVAYNDATGGLLGNWLPFLAMLLVLFLNIIGEEFWWRGVVLPRQELALGKWAWAVHGGLWAVFHVFKWWDVLNLLPVCLALSYVCSRRTNTTPGIVIHSVINGIVLIPLALAALGILG